MRACAWDQGRKGQLMVKVELLSFLAFWGRRFKQSDYMTESTVQLHRSNITNLVLAVFTIVQY